MAATQRLSEINHTRAYPPRPVACLLSPPARHALERGTDALGHGRTEGCRIRYRVAETISDPASLGYAYGAVNEHLGWRRGDEEGTVMALAALGGPARFRGVFARAIRLTRTGFALDPGLLPLRVLRHGWPRV